MKTTILTITLIGFTATLQAMNHTEFLGTLNQEKLTPAYQETAEATEDTPTPTKSSLRHRTPQTSPNSDQKRYVRFNAQTFVKEYSVYQNTSKPSGIPTNRSARMLYDDDDNDTLPCLFCTATICAVAGYFFYY